MTDAPDAAGLDAWWDRSLTSAGRADILKAAGLHLPSRVLWRHMSPEARVAVDAMRPAEFRPEDRETTPADTPDPLVTISELSVENSLLRGALFLNARALKTYHDSPHFELDDEGVPKLEVIVPPDAREKAADALGRANRLLKEPERGAAR